MRALIIDDERLARSELRRLLERHPEIEIVGEAANAKEARKAIDTLEPDLLFLDVQMPGETGFDLLSSLDSVPLVVFTTAYDEYALRAFEVSALDYLVKPVEPKRLARTVARLVAAANTAIAASRTGPSGRAAGLSGSGTSSSSRPLSENHRLFISEGERCWLVRLGDIRLFESDGNQTRVFLGLSDQPRINRSLNQLEAKLDERMFFRANRHQIVNVKAVRSVRQWFGGQLMATLDGGVEITLSRRRARAFKELLSV